jgi:peptide/nickel transport system substrate-binding protein
MLKGHPITRRQLLRRGAILAGGSVVLTGLLAACRGTTPEASPTAAPAPAGQATPTPMSVITPAQSPAPATTAKRGGTLRVAIIGEPPALDPQFTTATLTANITWHMFEALFYRDKQFSPKPLLAESYEFTENNKVLTIKLRSNVKFHDGRPLTGDDAIASLLRYSKLSGRGRNLFTRVANLDKVDTHTIRFEFKEPTGIALIYLAQVDSFIMPKDLAEAYPDKGLEQFIGTGPFKFKERLPDRYIALVPNEDYTPVDGGPDGYGGTKIPYFDEIRFIPVPEQAVRGDGLVTGEFDFAEQLSLDNYDAFKAEPNLTLQVTMPYYFYGAHFNKSKESIMSNPKLRNALLAAVDVEPVARAGFSRPEFYRLYSSQSAPETPWHTDSGAEYYNQRNDEKAKQLLAEAGYDGRPIRWLSTKEYSYNYNMALVLKQQLEAIGVTIDLQVMDWATLVKTRSQRDAWDIFITGHESYQHPVLQPYMNPTWPGFWENAQRDQLVQQLMGETDEARIKELARELDRVWWEDAVMIKVCEGATLRGYTKKLQGYANLPDWFFWNCWFG